MAPAAKCTWLRKPSDGGDQDNIQNALIAAQAHVVDDVSPRATGALVRRRLACQG